MNNKLKYRWKVLMQYSNLIGELIKRDIKLKYRRSFFGYVWSVLNPLLIMVVLTVVFSAMFKRNIENYPIYLITGRVLMEFMKSSTLMGLKSVTGNAALLKKTYIPKYVFTLAKTTSSFVDTVFSFGAFVIVMIATRSPFFWQLIFVPFVLIQVYLFSLGLSFLLAQMNVFFRDIEYIYHAICVAWTYLTPIFYPIERLPNLLQVVIRIFNPMYCYITQFRYCALYGRVPPVGMVVAGWFWAALMMAFGLYEFRKNQDRFILFL